MRGRRIVLTGGPGGGKTTALDLFRREVGDSVVVVPEAATMLFAGGFPRVSEDACVRATQRAIYQVQRSLEKIVSFTAGERVQLCDRGAIDGAAYWPDRDLTSFFDEIDSTLEKELRRYDAVIFFQTAAAVGNGEVKSGNKTRTEGPEQAIALDRRLRELWSRHPQFTFVPNSESFFDKLHAGMIALRASLKKFEDEA